MKIWIDFLSPPHILFFNSILDMLKSEERIITVRDRAENVELIKLFGIDGIVIGVDHQNKIRKAFSYLSRTFQLFLNVKDFDFSLSQENIMSITVAKLRKEKSVSFCDNDLKLIPSNNFLQSFETKIKSFADYIVIPESAEDIFRKYMKKNKIFTYSGFKEDVYIADYQPDPEFNRKIPFEDYVVLRPEALGSFYVDENKSLVPDLLNRFNRENINVVYLPRDIEDFDYVKDFNVYIPKVPLNGLDLCFHANVVLTGSGTMAREASCLGVPSVSFFPGKELLSVDRKLINENKMFHSRDLEKIIEYVLLNKVKNKQSLDFKRSKNVKNEVVKIIKDILYEN